MNLLIRFLSAVLGWRRVFCSADFALPILNVIRREGVEIWGLCRHVEGGITFCLLDREYRHLLAQLIIYT